MTRHAAPLLGLCVLASFLVGFMALSEYALRSTEGAGHEMQKEHVPGGRLPVGTVVIGGAKVQAEIADEPAEQVQGLSNHAPLSDTGGMFFIFPNESAQGFWMKDMLFSLDMIWLDRNLVVVDVTEGATPASYPAIFSPEENAQYVLEVNAGFAQAHGIAKGTKATVTLPDGSTLP